MASGFSAVPPLVTDIDLSMDDRFLYVACYDASSLNIIDLNSATFSSRSVTLSAKPQGVAVGLNEKVLISTIGTGTGANVLSLRELNYVEAARAVGMRQTRIALVHVFPNTL